MHASVFTPIHRPLQLPRNIKPASKKVPAAKPRAAKSEGKAKAVSPAGEKPRPKRNTTETPEEDGKTKKKNRSKKD